MKYLSVIVNRGPLGWFRRLFHIVKMYRSDLTLLAIGMDEQRGELDRAVHFIKKATKVHADIAPHPKSHSTIVVCGTYKGRDHVQVFTVNENIDGMIEQLRKMQKYAQLGNIDTPYGMDVTIKRELGI